MSDFRGPPILGPQSASSPVATYTEKKGVSGSVVALPDKEAGDHDPKDHGENLSRNHLREWVTGGLLYLRQHDLARTLHGPSQCPGSAYTIDLEILHKVLLGLH